MFGIEGHALGSITLNAYSIFQLPEAPGGDSRGALIAVLTKTDGSLSGDDLPTGGHRFKGVVMAHSPDAALARMRRHLEGVQAAAAPQVARNVYIAPIVGANTRCPSHYSANDDFPPHPGEEPGVALRIERALAVARDGNLAETFREKNWVIDQMVRALVGGAEQYADFVASARSGIDGPETYEWDCGV